MREEFWLNVTAKASRRDRWRRIRNGPSGAFPRRRGTRKEPAEQAVWDIRRRTRKHHWAEEKIRIVLEGLRGEDSMA